MENEHQPDITSFVIRFVREQTKTPETPSPYRGSIRHIQTDEECVFTRWEDAVNFIRNYVPVETGDANAITG